MVYEYGNMEYEVSYRNVRYARVDMREGKIIIILPYGKTPEEILEKHGKKIYKKWKEIKDIKEAAIKNIKQNEVILLGKRYRVEKKSGKHDIDRKNNVIYVSLENPHSTKEFLKDILRKRIDRKVKKYSKIIGIESNKIFIREQITKWGSCSNRKNLSFNLRLIFTPENFFEYIVLHEVLHLKYMNHGKEFRKELKRIYGKKIPDDRTMMRYWFRSEFMMENLGITSHR